MDCKPVELVLQHPQQDGLRLLRFTVCHVRRWLVAETWCCVCLQCPANLNLTVQQAAYVDRADYECVNSAGQKVSMHMLSDKHAYAVWLCGALLVSWVESFHKVLSARCCKWGFC